MPSNLCGLRPSLFFFGRKPSKLMEVMKKPRFPRSQRPAKGLRKANSSFQSTGNFFQMLELRKKIIAFRDMIDLPPCNSSIPINKLVIMTMTEINNFYPEMSHVKASQMKGLGTHQALAHFCTELQAMGDSSLRDEEEISNNKNNLDKLVEITIATLNAFMKSAREKLEMAEKDEDEENKELDEQDNASVKASNNDSYSDGSSTCSSSPATPTSVLPEIIPLNSLYSSPLLLSLRVKAVGKLNPLDMKRLAFNVLQNVGTQKAKLLNKKRNKLEQLDAERTPPNQSKDYSIPNEIMKFPLHFPNGVGNPGSNTEVIELLLPLSARESEEMQLEEAVHAAMAKVLPAKPLTESPTEMEIEETESPPPLLDEELQVLQSDLEVPRPSPPLPPTKPSNVVATPPPPQPPPLPPKTIYNKASEQVPPPPTNPTTRPIARLPSLEVSPSHLAQKTPLATPPPTPPPSPTAVHFLGGGSPEPPKPQAPPTMLRSASTPCPPPPPPMATLKKLGQSLSPRAMPVVNGFRPPPPPPVGVGRSLRLKKATTKLKRSNQMGNLYRVLKGKVEGVSLPGKSSNNKKGGNGNSAGGKLGMADALAEMTKRSAYFQQIEEDVQKYAKAIRELQPLINNYKTTNMNELLEVHREVESILEKLTDETQVLARFESFPLKKLEAIRMAAALYTKLQSILYELQTFKINPPLGHLLDKVDRYFNKVKGDIDALERTKDEEAKKFKSHGIEFDFGILIHIKEAMVDVSSNCMELALAERKELNPTEATTTQKKASSKMLWKAFQFAFRVYTFAGGHDDRADRLTREIAQEIQNDMQSKLS